MKQEASGNKKAKIEIPVKEEPLDPETGGRAISVAAPVAQFVAKLDKPFFDCPLCLLPLKPPVFQCPAKHVACGVCATSNLLNRCDMCIGGEAAYEPSDGLVDAVLLGIKVPCPNEVYGCQSSVAYCLVRDHEPVCPHAPCNCPESGCDFLGSPPMLYSHLQSQHHWRGTHITYNEKITVAMQPTERRLLLAAEDGDGERLFLVVASARSGRGRDVKVVCVRASEDAGPFCYWGKVWTFRPEDPVSGNRPLLMYEDRARCCGVLSEDAAMDVGGKYLHLPFEDTPPGDEFVLRVRIDKLQRRQSPPTYPAAGAPPLG